MLGTVGDNPLVCFGINPSIAMPNSLDPTVRRVTGLAAAFGFDSWTILNVYPQIEKLIYGRQLTVLGSWGGLIESRPYLHILLADVVRLTDATGCNCVSYGDPLVGGHPQHLSRSANGLPLVPFDMNVYLPHTIRRRHP